MVFFLWGGTWTQAKEQSNIDVTGHLSISWDSLTRSPLIIRGLKAPLLEISHLSRLNRAQITMTGPLVVKKYAALLKIQPDQLRLKGAEKISGTWYLSYWQTFQGTIIYESSLGFSIDPQGRVASMGTLIYPQVRVSNHPGISREKALRIAREQIQDFKKFDYRLLAENMVIFPERKTDSITYYRVYAFNFFPKKALDPTSVVGGWAVFVDSQTGKVVQIQTLYKPLGCCVPENWTPPKSEDLYKGIFGD